LKLLHQKMMKVPPSLLITEMEIMLTMLTKNGRLSTLTKLTKLELRASTRNSDSISIDHSISDQECQWKELLSATVLIMFGWRDGEKTLMHSNGTSMRSQRPLRTTTGNHILLISKEMVDLLILDAQPLTLGGGNYSNTKMLLLLMKKEKF
jgi:hypothetical protein